MRKRITPKAIVYFIERRSFIITFAVLTAFINLQHLTTTLGSGFIYTQDFMGFFTLSLIILFTALALLYELLSKKVLSKAYKSRAFYLLFLIFFIPVSTGLLKINSHFFNTQTIRFENASITNTQASHRRCSIEVATVDHMTYCFQKTLRRRLMTKGQPVKIRIADSPFGLSLYDADYLVPLNNS